MNKTDIDKQAEREANALHKQGQYKRDKRINRRDNYNADKFNKLFRR